MKVRKTNQTNRPVQINQKLVISKKTQKIHQMASLTQFPTKMNKIVKIGKICNATVVIDALKLWKTAIRTCRKILKLLATTLHLLLGTMIMVVEEVAEEVEVVEDIKEDEVVKEAISRIAETTTTKATEVVIMSKEAEGKDVVAMVTTKVAMVVAATIIRKMRDGEMMDGDKIIVEAGTAMVVEETTREEVVIIEVDINRAEGAMEISSTAKVRFFKIKKRNSNLIRKRRSKNSRIYDSRIL